MPCSANRCLALVLGATALFSATTATQAQPASPLRVILPAAAGSGVDTIMRAAQNEMSKGLGGQPVAGPKGLPAAQAKRLHDAFVTAFASPEVMAAMAKQDNVIAPTTPEAALAFPKSEQERYAKIVKKADVKIE